MLLSLGGRRRQVVRRPRAVTDGYATCTKEAITQVRTRILENFTKLTQSKQEFFTSSEEQEGHAITLLGESSSVFQVRQWVMLGLILTQT